MRISDWSSDVCSSDLGVDAGHARLVGEVLHPQRHVPGIQAPGRGRVEQGEAVERAPELRVEAERILRLGLVVDVAAQGQQAAPERDAVAGGGVERSEEHTSELQSLMRISYAVFCLQKKKT